MMARVFFGLLILSCFFTSAQPRMQETGLDLRYNVLGHLDPKFPSHDIGIELAPIQGLSIIYEHGFIYSVESLDDELIRGRKSNIEARFNFILPDDETVTLFIGGRYSYREAVVRGRYVLGYQCSTDSNNDCVYYTDFLGDVSTRFSGTQIIFGGKFTVAGPLLFEGNIGLGRYKNEVDESSIEFGKLVQRTRFFRDSDFRTDTFVNLKGTVIFKIK